MGGHGGTHEVGLTTDVAEDATVDEEEADVLTVCPTEKSALVP